MSGPNPYRYFPTEKLIQLREAAKNGRESYFSEPDRDEWDDAIYKEDGEVYSQADEELHRRGIEEE